MFHDISGAPPGNLNALKHGLYSKQVRQSIIATLAEMPRGFQDESDLLRLVIQRAALFAGDAYNIDDAVRLLGTIARATSNLDWLVCHHVDYFYDNPHSPERLVIDSISEETNELLLKRVAVIAERWARQAALWQEQMSNPKPLYRFPSPTSSMITFR